MSDARLVLRATGLLRTFNELGVPRPADVHVAQRLGTLAAESDERVLLAVALAVRGVRQGSVVLRLADVPEAVTPDDAEDEPTVAVELPWPATDGWVDALMRSPLVGASGTDGVRPLRWEDGGIWLDKYWRQEVDVASSLTLRAAQSVAVDEERLGAALLRLWPGAEPHDQRLAAAVAVLAPVAVISGGPGTGKTTTVAGMLAALHASAARPPRVALAAPTGKAAARLQEAVVGAAASDRAFSLVERDVLRASTASTLHRLLGVRRGSARYWHHAGNPLPHDVVVVDEASMVSLTMFARLLDALRPAARLVLVGDPDQLASVEAGAVLADLVGPASGGSRTAGFARRLASVVPNDVPVESAVAGTERPRVRDGVAVLRTVHRYDAGGVIAAIAHGIRRGDAAAVLEALRSGDGAVTFHQVADDAPVAGEALAAVRTAVVSANRGVIDGAAAGDAPRALTALAAHRLLCGHRRGPRGVAHWGTLVQRWLVEDLEVSPTAEGRYAGLPLLVTANDYDNGLYNGDTGVVLGVDGGFVAAFDRGDGPYVLPLARLADAVPLHAMTVHRGQGSQFDRVTVILPPAGSPLGHARDALHRGDARQGRASWSSGSSGQRSRSGRAPGRSRVRPARPPVLTRRGRVGLLSRSERVAFRAARPASNWASCVPPEVLGLHRRQFVERQVRRLPAPRLHVLDELVRKANAVGAHVVGKVPWPHPYAIGRYLQPGDSLHRRVETVVDHGARRCEGRRLLEVAHDALLLVMRSVPVCLSQAGPVRAPMPELPEEADAL
jgi:exodeoxyribonuclease V alpha subunit